MFQHSIKVPRHYKVAASILKKAYTEGANVKTLLYADKFEFYRVDVLYALVMESIKRSVDLDALFESIKLFEKEPRLDQWLAKILTTELLFGKKTLPGESKPVQTILSYSKDFDKYVCENADRLNIEVTRKPRYVRVNTNYLSVSDAIEYFQEEGYFFIPCEAKTYGEYMEVLRSITEFDFTQDFHVKTVLAFAPGTKFFDHELYLEKKIILQDKATALPVHLLAPPPCSRVLDMCAAPGMKTTHCAAYMNNTGIVYAVERDRKRFETLCHFVKDTGCYSVEPIHCDVLDITKTAMKDVEYILLDPSCSGSGMDHSIYDYKNDEERLEKLTSLQEKLLKHAMNSFPAAKRIVYSTCSINPEENERVVVNVVKASRTKWILANARELLGGQWTNCGSNIYGGAGTRCLYARPNSDLTIGFFIAVLDRKEKDLLHTLKMEDDKKRPEEKEKARLEGQKAKTGEKSDEQQSGTTTKRKKHSAPVESQIFFLERTKRMKHQKMFELPYSDSENKTKPHWDSDDTKKKQKERNKDHETSYSDGDSATPTAIEELYEYPKKRTKKKKHIRIEENTETSATSALIKKISDNIAFENAVLKNVLNKNTKLGSVTKNTVFNIDLTKVPETIPKLRIPKYHPDTTNPTTVDAKVDFTSAATGDGDELLKKRKKLKKDKHIANKGFRDTADSEGDYNSISAVFLESQDSGGIPKKTKNKRYKELVETTTSEGENILKSKKKRKTDGDTETLNIIIDDLSDLAVASGSGTFKKKRKDKKIKESDKDFVADEITQGEISEKKKRKRDRVPTETDVTESHTEPEVTSKKKKGKKAVEVVTVDMAIEAATEEMSAKSKKSKKKYRED